MWLSCQKCIQNIYFWLTWLLKFVSGRFRGFLCHCSLAGYSRLKTSPKQGRMSVFSCCAIMFHMFNIPFRSDWQLVIWSVAVRAPEHSPLVRHAESLAAQEAGEGQEAGMRARGDLGAESDSFWLFWRQNLPRFGLSQKGWARAGRVPRFYVPLTSK